MRKYVETLFFWYIGKIRGEEGVQISFKMQVEVRGYL